MMAVNVDLVLLVLMIHWPGALGLQGLWFGFPGLEGDTLETISCLTVHPLHICGDHSMLALMTNV